jgi:hypothetical protein
MIGLAKFLPGTGRGTMRSMVVGPVAAELTPPSALAGCHLPVPGRIVRE